MKIWVIQGGHPDFSLECRARERVSGGSRREIGGWEEVEIPPPKEINKIKKNK